ncbi:MAG: threonine synthase [Treponema sp.]|nr:threonine synthase [Treponema sp.]
MRLTSTRDKSVTSTFSNAIRNCMPADGGLYVPDGNADLRRWILYTNEETSFSSIAGTLTSACINNEYSPIICETIATRAFPFEPVLKQIDNGLFELQLYHGPTGCYRDFGVSYLAATMETICQLEKKKAVFIDYTTGEHGSLLAKVLRGKKNVKAILVYPKGKVAGIQEEDFVWNGGNIYPIEADGDEKFCRELLQNIFASQELVTNYNLSVSNTANFGRVLPQSFFYTWAFSRLKDKVDGDIYYSMDPANYSNLVAGLYSWRLCLPVNGFIVPASGALTVDARGNALLMDSVVPVLQRPPADPSDPTNLERMEDFFSHHSLMMKNFVYAAKIDDAALEQAEKDLFIKYGMLADRSTANAYAAAMAHPNLFDENGTVVLLSLFHNGWSKDFIRHCTGETVEVPDFIKDIKAPVNLKQPLVKSVEDVVEILKKLNG